MGVSVESVEDVTWEKETDSSVNVVRCGDGGCYASGSFVN